MIKKLIKSREIVIGIESDKLKIIGLNINRKEINVLDYFTIDLIDKLDLLDQINHIKNKISFKNILKTNSYLVIGDEEAKAEIIKIPKTDYKKQVQILDYKYMEYEKDSYLQYLYLEQVEDNGLSDSFLVSRLTKKRVEKYKLFVRELGLVPRALDIKSNSIMKLMRFSGLINTKYSTVGDNLLFIDFQAMRTNIILLENNRISYLNTINLGRNYILNNQDNEDGEIIGLGDRLENIMDFINSLLGGLLEKVSLTVIEGFSRNKFVVKETCRDLYGDNFILIDNLRNVNIKYGEEDLGQYFSYLGGIIRQEEAR